MARFNRVLKMFGILIPYVLASVWKLQGRVLHVQLTSFYQTNYFPFPLAGVMMKLSLRRLSKTVSWEGQGWPPNSQSKHNFQPAHS